MRATFGALALWGALLNAFVLANHITSLALISLQVSSDSIVICHRGELSPLDDAKKSEPASKKRCPICSGLATLHLGVLAGEPNTSLASFVASEEGLANEADALIAGSALHRIFNRGPPRLA